MPEVTGRVDRKSKARLEKLAKTTRRTVSALVAEAVRSYIDIQEWQIAGIKAAIKEADAGNFATDEEVEATLQKWRQRAQQTAGAADRRRSHAFSRRAQ